MRHPNSLCVLTRYPVLGDRSPRVPAIQTFVKSTLDCGDIRFSSAGRLTKLVLQGSDGQEGARLERP